jgi:hypothetical protein
MTTLGGMASATVLPHFFVMPEVEIWMFSKVI